MILIEDPQYISNRLDSMGPNFDAYYYSNELAYVWQNEIGQRVNYTDNTGMVLISTANTNLDGTGTLGTVLTAASSGTLIRTITIKAIGTTTKGMVRLYIEDSGGTNTDIVAEIEIPAVIPSGTRQAFSTVLEVDYVLENTYKLRVSTQNAESFVVIAEGLNIAFP
ncbi:MAG TPA: hypothetical protein VD905_20875 [Flavobacteriales bacterium]|nr:hypothetical protein [Flavobacteriales bacterium]